MRDESGCTIYWMLFIAAVAAIGLIVGESNTAVDLTFLVVGAASLLILLSYGCVWLNDKRTGRELCRRKEDRRNEESN